MWALGRVKLIPEASQADVLSDVGLSATGRAGELALIFVRPTARDRAPSGAMRPEAGCLDRKSFSPGFMLAAAQLFTGGSGEPSRALLPTGEITVEAVSAAQTNNENRKSARTEPPGAFQSVWPQSSLGPYSKINSKYISTNDKYLM